MGQNQVSFIERRPLFLEVTLYSLSILSSQSAGSFDDMQDVATSSPSSRRAVGGGQAGNIRAKFENMANAEQQVGVALSHMTDHVTHCEIT